jgi:hypothetical protein
MKLRHAAALALVGWYLMMPPASSLDPDSSTYLAKAPLSQWKTVKRFDSKLECEEQAEGFHLFAKQEPNSQDWARNPRSYAECVSTDDQRLKSN